MELRIILGSLELIVSASLEEIALFAQDRVDHEAELFLDVGQEVGISGVEESLVLGNERAEGDPLFTILLQEAVASLEVVSNTVALGLSEWSVRLAVPTVLILVNLNYSFVLENPR